MQVYLNGYRQPKLSYTSLETLAQDLLEKRIPEEQLELANLWGHGPFDLVYEKGEKVYVVGEGQKGPCEASDRIDWVSDATCLGQLRKLANYDPPPTGPKEILEAFGETYGEYAGMLSDRGVLGEATQLLDLGECWAADVRPIERAMGLQRRLKPRAENIWAEQLSDGTGRIVFAILFTPA